MAKERTRPVLGEIEKQLTEPLFTANIEITKDTSIIVTTFDWHGEKFTKLILHSILGSQTMLLDRDALQEVVTAFIDALENSKA